MSETLTVNNALKLTRTLNWILFYEIERTINDLLHQSHALYR